MSTTTVKRFVEGDRRLKIYRYSKTGALFSSWICLGLYNEVIGPTLPDLKDRIGCNYEEVSRVLSARSAGLFIGSVTGGLLHDGLSRHRDLLIALALLVSALTITIAPWCPSLWSLGVVFHVMGHSHALLTTGGNPTIPLLWADRSAGPYNVLHSGFGLGATIGPIMSRPFMATRKARMGSDGILNSTIGSPYHDVIIRDTNGSNDNLSRRDWYTNGSTAAAGAGVMTSRIEYPYSVVGLCCTVVAAIFFFFFFSDTPEPFRLKKRSWKEILNPRSCAGGHTLFGVKMLCLIFLFYMFVVGGERAFGKFMFSYAIESKLQMSTDEAAWLNSIYWICYTAARLLASVASRWAAPHVLLFVQTTGTLLSAILLDIFPDNVPAVWTFTMTFGFFKSALFPSCLGWANRYVEISPMTITCVNLGSSTGGMIVQWMTGYMFEYYGPRSFLHIIVAYSVAIFLVFVVMHVTATSHGDRFMSERGVGGCKEEEVNGGSNKNGVTQWSVDNKGVTIEDVAVELTRTAAPIENKSVTPTHKDNVVTVINDILAIKDLIREDTNDVTTSSNNVTSVNAGGLPIKDDHKLRSTSKRNESDFRSSHTSREKNIIGSETEIDSVSDNTKL